MDNKIKAHRAKIALRTINHADKAPTREGELIDMLTNFWHLVDEWGLDWGILIRKSNSRYKTNLHENQ